MALEITDDNIKEILAQNDITVLDFFAPWCGPCKTVGPIIDQLAVENEGIAIGKVNVEENPDLAAEHKVRAIPAIIFYKNGTEVNRMMECLFNK
jgi:thioredoxin 1